MTLLRRLNAVLGRRRRLKWALLVAIALLLSGVEVVAATLVYVLLTLVTDPGGGLDLPVLGDPVELVPGLSPNAIALGVTIAIAAFFVVRGALLLVQAYAEARVVNNAAADIGSRLVEGYLSMPYVLHLQRNSAELVRNAFYNVETVKRDLLQPGLKALAESLVIVGLTLALVVVAPLATLGALALFGPLVWILLRLVKPRMKAYGRGAKEAESRGLSVLQQGLAGIRELRVTGSEDHFARRYRRTRREFARLRTRKAVLAQFPRVMIETLLVVAIAGFFVLVMEIQQSGQQAVSLLGLFAYVGMRLKPSIQVVVQGVNSVRYAMPSLDDIAHDLEETAGFEAAALPARGGVPHLRHELRLDGIEFRYPGSDVPALDEVDLTIECGRSLGICGPTGGGKSTLVDVLAGLVEPTAGTIRVDGVDVHADVRAWYAQLGVVSQHVFLLDATLRENIALGVSTDAVDDEAVDRAVRLAQLDDVVRELPEGLQTRVGERGIRLSGGQRQRVAIARALYRDPRVLLFDEGTSALDNRTEAELVRALEGLRGRQTVVLVAHRLTTMRHCDRIVVIEHGRITDAGTFDELTERNPLFAAMQAAGVQPPTTAADGPPRPLEPHTT